MREITSTLWIGNALEARDLKLIHDLEFKTVVDLAINEPPLSPTRELVYLRLPLNDGAGNSPALLKFTILSIVELLKSGTKTLVACSAGISRSPAVVAAALSIHQKLDYQEALTRIATNAPSDCSASLVTGIAKLITDSSFP
ncbi:dual specificity protein phosphatase family protein [Calycomorphotria hydatis]|uniref:Tyrosine specific protein phosphatases domain-containing protein n=1 Tax=Calycomorphotria hydatis TaxID=2528027 RepID=A0A517TEY0_9PLAN|nr:dual specificity protein phosphatase [Calycomorphotria hydatis]QDT66926.1 hypothetical protein V22_41980 [Calycomorphotria hydatis]